MKQLPYIQTSSAIIGYTDSFLAQTESNDCFVRAVASAYQVDYEEAHAWVKKHFKRKDKKGTANVTTIMEMFSQLKKVFNKKLIRIICLVQKVDTKTGRLKRNTVNNFVKTYPTGTYIIIVQGHAFTIMNGFIIGNPEDSKSIKKQVLKVYKIS